MNVLLTCAGRRNYLVQYFRTALADQGRVVACDSSADAPALMDADRGFLVPRLDHPTYFDVLRDICQDQSVRLLISVHEVELPALARQAARFREIGTMPVVSSIQTIETCQDKWATFCFLRAANISTPDTYLTIGDARAALAHKTLQFPLIIKPRWGSGSSGIARVYNERELGLAHDWCRVQADRSSPPAACLSKSPDCFIFQECIPGQEFGMDIVNDLDGDYVTSLVRRKLSMRAGITDRAVSVIDTQLEAMGKNLGERLAHVGSLDCDIMRNERGSYVLDLNPRFGGGYPFSHAAGANLPAALVAWAKREKADPGWLKTRPGVVSSQYDSVMIIDQAARHLSRRDGLVTAGEILEAGVEPSLSCAALPSPELLSNVYPD